MTTIILSGRSIGMRDLSQRLSQLDKKAKEKNLGFGWDNMGTHYEVYLQDLTGKKIYEETVLTRGVLTVKKINCFHDILEHEIDKINL